MSKLVEILWRFNLEKNSLSLLGSRGLSRHSCSFFSCITHPEQKLSENHGAVWMYSATFLWMLFSWGGWLIPSHRTLYRASQKNEGDEEVIHVRNLPSTDNLSGKENGLMAKLFCRSEFQSSSPHTPCKGPMRNHEINACSFFCFILVH
jgi:hypothetical protein